MKAKRYLKSILSLQKQIFEMILQKCFDRSKFVLVVYQYYTYLPLINVLLQFNKGLIIISQNVFCILFLL